MRKPMVAMMMTPRDPARRALLVAANSSNSLMMMTMRTKMTSPLRKTALAMRAKKAVRTRTTMMMPRMPRMKMRTWTTALTRMSSKPSRRRPLLSTFLAPEGPGVVLEPLPSSLRRSSPRNDVIN